MSLDKLLRVEFHCHTIYSEDSLVRPEAIVEAARRKGIDRLVITDHNTIEGARRAREIDPELVIVGEEIMTQGGELLAAFVEEEVPAGLPAREAIQMLREQGAFISVSHPFDRLRSGGWALDALEAIRPLVDAIEVFNARCFPPRFNEEAREYTRRHGLRGTVGSDAHTAYELGLAAMLLPAFEDAEGLRKALEEARYETRRSPLWTRLASRYAVLRKRVGREERS